MANTQHLTPFGPSYTNVLIDESSDAQSTEENLYQRGYTGGAHYHSYQPSSLGSQDSCLGTDEHEASGEAHRHTHSTKDAIKGGVHVNTEPEDEAASKDGTRISWLDPLLAISLFVGSTLAAMGHHIYYESLENTPVYSDAQQVWAIRIGTGLALLARCGLVATIGIVAVQQTWATLGQKSISIGGIDSMFEVMGNPWSFLNKDLLIRAKRLYVIAGISWILPLVAVVTPATLTITPRMTQNQITTRVPYYNFSNTDGWPIYGGRGWFTGVGPEVTRLFTSTYTSNSFVPQSPPFPNASYDLKFWGPSYKCSNLSEIIQTDNSATWDLSLFSNYTSVEAAFYGEIGPPTSPLSTFNVSGGYVFKSSAPYSMSNMILIGTGGFNRLWDDSDYNVRLVCQLYNTSYDINIRFDNGIQSITENSVEYLEAQNWNSTQGRSSNLLDSGACVPDPDSNNITICPTYYLTHYTFGDFLSGRIFTNTIGEVIYEKGNYMIGAGSAPVFQSDLMDCPEIWNSSDFLEATRETNTFQTFDRCHGGTLATAIESLSKNFTYSLMTYRNWQDVAAIEAPVTVSSPRNFFAYDKRTLLASYLTSILVTLGCIVIGSMALRSNGYTSSTAFSSMLLTTRNPDLDRLAVKNTLGAKPLPDFISDTKLRFGIIRSREFGFQPGFGFDGTVTPFGNATSFSLPRRKAERH